MREAIRALGVSRQTVLQRVKRGELEAIHVTRGRHLGRMLERESKLKVLRYPAIAEKDTQHYEWRPAPTPYEPFREVSRPYVWKQGTPLFPQWKPLDFLLERKRWESEAGWSSLYQQHPIIVGGGELPIDNFKWMPRLDPHNIRKSVRGWDKAGTEREPGTAQHDDAGFPNTLNNHCEHNFDQKAAMMPIGLRAGL
jgi:hypothetical protein